MWSKEEFVNLVKDAYEHLYDLVYLRNHSLADVFTPDPAVPRKKKAWQLHQTLLDIIEELNPGPQARTFSREWRRHRLMVLRYMQGLDPQEVATQITTSRRHYYRLHNAAIEAIANILRDRWILQPAQSQHPSSADMQSGVDNNVELLRLEVARVSQTNRHARVEKVIEGIRKLLQEKLRQREFDLQLSLPDSTPNVFVDQSLLRQILLGILGYLIERAEQATLRLTVQIGDDTVNLSVRIEPPAAVQPTPRAELQERLAAFEEMAASSNVNILTVQTGQAVVGFDIQLPTVEQTILVVDDNEDVLKLFQRYLSAHHYRVITAQTAQEALELTLRSRPYAITLDLMMPDQDGWDLIQALLNKPETQNIPIIVCSVLKQQKELALSLGAAVFLEKPVTEESLLSAIRALEGASGL